LRIQKWTDRSPRLQEAEFRTIARQLCAPTTLQFPILDQFWGDAASCHEPAEVRALAKLCITRLRHGGFYPVMYSCVLSDSEFARLAATAVEEATVSDDLFITLADRGLEGVPGHWIALVADKLSQ
jgi:hypothetical protein